MRDLVKELCDLASQINVVEDDDEILKLKPQFDTALNTYFEKVGDFTTLYEFDQTTMMQQRMIDDAIVNICHALERKKLIDRESLGDFFGEKE